MKPWKKRDHLTPEADADVIQVIYGPPERMSQPPAARTQKVFRRGAAPDWNDDRRTEWQDGPPGVMDTGISAPPMRDADPKVPQMNQPAHDPDEDDITLRPRYTGRK